MAVFTIVFWLFFNLFLYILLTSFIIFFKKILHLIKEVLYLTTNKREMNKQYTYTNFWFFYFRDKSWD